MGCDENSIWYVQKYSSVLIKLHADSSFCLHGLKMLLFNPQAYTKRPISKLEVNYCWQTKYGPAGRMIVSPGSIMFGPGSKDLSRLGSNNTRMDLDFVTDENLRELIGEEAWEAIENFAQGQKLLDNLPNIISEQELGNLKAKAKRLFGNENVWVEMHKGIHIASDLPGRSRRDCRNPDRAVESLQQWQNFSAVGRFTLTVGKAQRLQAQEQEELTDEEKARLFVQFLEQIRKHFAAKRAEEKRNKPPTRAQQRSFMCTYLKNMEGWKPKDLKNKSFVNIQELFDKAMKRVNTFVDYRTELVEESSKKAEAEIAQESSSKRADTKLEQESIKKQKVDEDKETTELQRLIEIIPDKEEVAIDAIPLATKPPSIVDYKIYKEGKKTYYQIIRANGSSKMYIVFS
ncbi:hypothetical protein Tco_1267106, partial [Tanacetum coccineum]